MKTKMTGFNFKLTVGIEARADKYAEMRSDKRSYTETDNRDNTYDISGEGILAQANLNLDLNLDTYEGEVDLGEITEMFQTLVNSHITEEISRQVSEQLHPTETTTEETPTEEIVVEEKPTKKKAQ